MAEMHFFGTPHDKKINLALKEWKSVDPINRIIPTKKIAVQKDNLNPDKVDMKYCRICQIE